MQRQELLAESQIFEDEVLTGTEGTDNPTDEVPEARDHGSNIIEILRDKLFSKPFILRVQEVLTRDSPALQVRLQFLRPS